MAFSTNSLSTSLLAELSAARTTTAPNPDTLTDVVREAMKWLWVSTDWRFRRKQGSLVTVATEATIDMPKDFAEMDHRWLREAASYISLRFTENVSDYQAVANRFVSADAGPPRVAVIVRDTGVTSLFKWHFLLTPTPDDVYTYTYWYVVTDPATENANGGETFTDASKPIWPITFDEGWRLRAKFGAEAIFDKASPERSQRTEDLFNSWYATQVAENNETLTLDLEPIRDGYSDFARTSRGAMHTRVG